MDSQVYDLLLLMNDFPGGESGSADTVRDPRGFAMKFYTDEGNWDLVGNNTPIFFIRDPILVCTSQHVGYIENKRKISYALGEN